MTHRRFKGFNQLQIEGSEIIKNLPDTNVLFVSNHQTYFADVVAMFNVFNASLSGRVDTIKEYWISMAAQNESLFCRRSRDHAGGLTAKNPGLCWFGKH